MDFLKRLSSRKFLLAFFAALIPILNRTLEWELTPGDLFAINAAVVAFIGVEGMRDIKASSTE